MFACNPYPVTQEMLDEVGGGGERGGRPSW